MKNFPLRISPVFLFKSGEDQKKKTSSLNFRPVFGPKLDEDRFLAQKTKKKKKKGFHSNLVRFLAQNWVQGKNKRLRLPFVCSNLLPKVQRGGACRNFAYYSMLIILSWRPKGVAMAQCPPPLNTPLRASAVEEVDTGLIPSWVKSMSI